MEEWVGKVWHRWITRAAGGHHPQAAVELKALARPLAIYFRALGGDPGLRVAAATHDATGHRRHWLARLAGSDERGALARRDDATLRLPPTIDAFAEPALNRDLYYWLAALAASHDALPEQAPSDHAHFVRRQQQATCHALDRWPGLHTRYHRLVEAYLPCRPLLASLPPAEAAREVAIRQALQQPGSIESLPPVPAGTPPAQPVLLWLHANLLEKSPSAPAESRATAPGDGSSSQDAGDEAHRGERITPPAEKNGLLMFFRAESLLSVAEFLRINRSVDDDPDPHAADAARNLEQLALATPDAGERIATRVRFDLDLPSAAADDLPLGEGMPLPEWDYRKGTLVADHVRLQELVAREVPAGKLPVELRRTAKRLHQQFAALQPQRRWLKGQPDGCEFDLDAIVRATTDRACGRHGSEQLFQSIERRERDLACLVLADLSLSTDAYVSSESRVIDVIRDTLLLFGEALRGTGDRFAMCGFSSVKRQVRFHRLKDFGERFGDIARGRIQAIKPGFYTRMGAAIRRSSQLLGDETAGRKVLIILSDGKPNDLDQYDSRYGIEDTRAAIQEARHQGIVPFCLTIDRTGNSYLPHLFGASGYSIIRNPVELPARLPLCYAQLTR